MDAVRALLDDLLELPVFPSFTTIGFHVRRRLFGWPDVESWSMAGRTVVITGATSGLGRDAAGSLARMGASLVLVGRDHARLERTRDELVAESGGMVETVVADMSSLASVRAAADEILDVAPRIDVLIDNAGAMYPTREASVDGIEMSVATMVVGPFVLIGRLWPRLAASGDPRIVAVSSGGMYAQRLPIGDLGYVHDPYQGARAYARAKRAQVALIREWARRLRAHGIVANAMHPGWADTPGLEASLPGFRSLIGGLLRSPAEGADTILWLASAPEARATSGRLFLDRRVRPFDRVPGTRLSAADRRDLWDQVVALTGEADPTSSEHRAGRPARS
jgi:NAD(P)-dependent dehydrogenase (short-subunit alcohol dehydrogenase family)